MKRRFSECVSGILLAGRKFLVEKRHFDDTADPGLVALPGGHVEIGESLMDALRRELREELGIEVEEARLVGREMHVASDGERQRIHYFIIEEWEGKPKALQAESVYWEHDTNRLIPADKAIMNGLLPDR